MTNRMEIGEDRSMVVRSDPLAAHYVQGWLAGYMRVGSELCPHHHGTGLRVVWLLGYCAGERERCQIAGERA